MKIVTSTGVLWCQYNSTPVLEYNVLEYSSSNVLVRFVPGTLYSSTVVQFTILCLCKYSDTARVYIYMVRNLSTAHRRLTIDDHNIPHPTLQSI